MLLLVAFFLTIAYYAVLIGLDQKRKQQFALSQQVVLPMVDSIVEPLVEPIDHSEIERSEKSDTNTVANSSNSINPDAVFGTLDDSKIMEHTIPNNTAIAIDHLVQTDQQTDKENIKFNIPKLDTIPIANAIADTTANTLTKYPKI